MSDWSNRRQESTGSVTFDISRLVGTIYWYKTTWPYRKDVKTTRERCCGCRQRRDSGTTPGLIDTRYKTLHVHRELKRMPEPGAFIRTSHQSVVGWLAAPALLSGVFLFDVVDVVDDFAAFIVIESVHVISIIIVQMCTPCLIYTRQGQHTQCHSTFNRLDGYHLRYSKISWEMS